MNKEEAFKYLKGLLTVVLSTVGPHGFPNAAVMFFTVDRDLCFYLLTKTNTQKYTNAKENGKVALTFLDPNHPKTVQLQGKAEELPVDSQEYLTALTEISSKNAALGGSSWPPPLSKIPESKIAILKITPFRIRFGDYTKSGEEVFHQIIPVED